MLNIDFFLPKCLVSVIWNSKSIHSFLFKLCIMIVHTLKMCTSILCTFYEYIFFIFWGLGLGHVLLEMLRWFLVCVICNSSSFHSFIFKLCIMIEHVHPIFVHINFDNVFLSVQIRNCYVTYCRLHCEIWM